MKPRRIAFMIVILFSFWSADAQEKIKIVRIAKIVVDSAQLEKYQAAVREQIETAVRVEPGVLTLYAVAEKNRPTHITVFEIYSSADAYKAHLETAHFKKYKSATREMVKSLELIDSVPIALAAKPK